MNDFKWHMRYLRMAQLVASWSKDPSTKCGAVIVSPLNEIISTGYNGFPRGVEDKLEWLNDRNTKYLMTVHAEMNAIVFSKRNIENCTIYTWPFHACSQCAAAIIQTGMKHHVTLINYNDRWEGSWVLAQKMLDNANVKTTLYQPAQLETSNG